MKKLLLTFEDRTLPSIVKARNDLAHGGEWSERIAEAWIVEQDVYLREWLARVWQVMRFEVVLILSSEYDGKAFNHDARLVGGASAILPRKTFSTGHPLITGRLYSLGLGPSQDDVFGLFPLIKASASVEPSAWELSAFDGVERRKGSATEAESKIRYVSLWSGTRGMSAQEDLGAIPEALWPKA